MPRLTSLLLVPAALLLTGCGGSEPGPAGDEAPSVTVDDLVARAQVATEVLNTLADEPSSAAEAEQRVTKAADLYRAVAEDAEGGVEGLPVAASDEIAATAASVADGLDLIGACAAEAGDGTFHADCEDQVMGVVDPLIAFEEALSAVQRNAEEAEPVNRLGGCVGDGDPAMYC